MSHLHYTTGIIRVVSYMHVFYIIPGTKYDGIYQKQIYGATDHVRLRSLMCTRSWIDKYGMYLISHDTPGIYEVYMYISYDTRDARLNTLSRTSFQTVLSSTRKKGKCNAEG